MLKERGGEGGVAVTGAPPFWIEGPVPPALAGSHLFGREELVERFARRWTQRAPARTLVLGTALAGKRSAVRASLAATDAELEVVRVAADRAVPGTDRGLVAGFLAALRGRVPPAVWQERARAARHPDVDTPGLWLADLDRLLDALPGGRPLVVVEEAQAMADVDAGALDGLEAWSRASQAHVVVTATHVPSALRERWPDLFGAQRVRVSELGPVSRQSGAAFLKQRFASARCQATEEAVGLLLEFAGGEPAAVQWLGKHAVDLVKRGGGGRIDLDRAVEAVGEAVAHPPAEWVLPLGAVGGRMRDVFVAACLLGAGTVSEIARRVDVEPKNVSVLLGRLVERGLPVRKVGRGRYEVTNRVLREHVKARWS